MSQENEVDAKNFKIKEENPKRRFIDVLKDNLTCEMYHAFLEVFDSHHYIIKLHLALFLIVSYGLASYMTIQLIMSYFNYGVTTTIRTIYETPSTFPQVTICNLNSFTTNAAYDFLKYTDTDNLLDSLLSLNYYERTQKLWQILLKTGGLLVNQTKEFKMSLSHSLDDTLIMCQFNYEKCSTRDFIWTWDNYYGNCFSFNSGFNSSSQQIELKKSNLAGYSFGLELDFYVNYNEKLVFFNSILGGKGAVIRIDNITQTVQNVFDGIFVSTGMATNIALRREIKSILPKPYSSCIVDQGKDTQFDSDLFNKIKKSRFDYSQKFCLQQCMQRLLNQYCSCGFTPFANEIFF